MVAPTLSDVAKRLDPGGAIDKIVEILDEENEVLADMAWMEGNLPTGHRSTIRSGLPTATWRKLNYGVQPDRSQTVQVTDACGMLEAYAEVDKALADLNGNTAQFRLSEDRAFLEAMSQEMADTLFYGDTDTDPEKFMGLTYRYNDLSAENADNIIDAGGAGVDNHSIWLVVWGENTVFGMYPKGSKAGLSHRDLGEVTLEDAANGKYQGYRTHYKWDAGLVLKDWRYVVRIANIDNSLLTADMATGAQLADLMTQAIEIPRSLAVGRPVFYVNRTIRTFFRRQALNVNNVRFGLQEIAGRKAVTFDEVPIRRCDSLLNGTELQVV